MGLDVLAIWVALTVSMRGGKRLEVVTLWPGTLELKQVDAKGAEEVLTLRAANVRFVIDRDFNERVTGALAQGAGRRRALGAFLSAGREAELLPRPSARRCAKRADGLSVKTGSHRRGAEPISWPS